MLGIAAVKYVGLGLVLLGYAAAFRDVNVMFNEFSDFIANNTTGGADIFVVWMSDLANAFNTSGFEKLFELIAGGVAGLIGALFVLVVVAALGAFAVRINMTQQHDADLDLQQLRAEAGLNSGVEYAATRLLAPGANCGNLANLNVGGYAVTFNASLGTVTPGGGKSALPVRRAMFLASQKKRRFRSLIVLSRPVSKA